MVDFVQIAEKWQKKWEKHKVFEVKEDQKKKKFYCLEMFPYPSGAGLHMGHTRNYAIGDACARFKRMQGYNVLYPMGYDAFGLPAENAAIKNKIDPAEWTHKNIALMKLQQKKLGLSYDWSRSFATCDPEYYHWNQWIFLKLYEKNLAYKKQAQVNWCPSCHTVLANEQVIKGECWRCHSKVEPRDIEQWFMHITHYAEELLNDIDTLEWPERVKTMQRNWIGRSEGVEINFRLEKTQEALPVFTTRPDTIYGVSCLFIAPEHAKVLELVQGTKEEKEIKKFIEKVKTEDYETRLEKEKEGVFLGKYAINPINNEKIPIYAANFVIEEYGTGMVMCVPAHDQRDFEFAKKFKLPIKIVIQPKEKKLKEPLEAAYTDTGVLVNSGDYTGKNSEASKFKIAEYLEKKDWGKRTVQYKLRDWLISRQRYWGTPIPIIYCAKCGVVPVPEKELPVMLSKNVKFTGEGNPLEHCKEFVETTCPKCKGKAKRETDTMDTFVDSSWYFLRYCSSEESKKPFNQKAAEYWMPVDQYIGGIEHAILHLLYARFFTKVLRDMKLINSNEPFRKLLCQGMVTLGGKVMSKSKGNVVDPLTIIDKQGTDTARMYILFVSSPEKELEWSDQGVQGVYRFLVKMYELLEECKPIDDRRDRFVTSKTHKLIKEITKAMEGLEFNLAINQIMEFVHDITRYKINTSKKIFDTAVKQVLLVAAPIVPHICEEMWERMGHKGFISTEEWPSYDETKIDASVDALEDSIGRVNADVTEIIKIVNIKPKKITLFIADQWKYQLFEKLKEEKERDFAAIMKKVADKVHGQEVAKIVQSFVKGNIPLKNISKEKEMQALQDNKEAFEKIFNAEIAVIDAESSPIPKAKQALPGKPAIFLE